MLTVWLMFLRRNMMKPRVCKRGFGWFQHVLAPCDFVCWCPVTFQIFQRLHQVFGAHGIHFTARDAASPVGKRLLAGLKTLGPAVKEFEQRHQRLLFVMRSVSSDHFSDLPTCCALIPTQVCASGISDRCGRRCGFPWIC